MPAIALNRSNAWEFWKIGRIAATNIDNIGVDAPGTTPILANLAVKHGFNAVRYWLNWGITPLADYTLLPEDWQRIGWEGWDSTTVTTRSAQTSTPVTIAMVKEQVQRVLNRCQALGMGVIFTGNFLGHSNGPLWNTTTGAGLQGDLGLFWRETVNSFGTHPALIGIDLLNEPQPTAELSLAEARSNTRVDTWPRLAQYLIAVIRQVDATAQPTSTLPRIPLIVEGILEHGKGLNLFLNPANASDNSYLVRDYSHGVGNVPNASRADDRIVYSSHAYLPEQIAGQGVFDDRCLSLGTHYPINALARDWINPNGIPQAVIRNFTTTAGWDAIFQAETTLRGTLGQPVWIAEFGSVQPRLGDVHPPSATRASRQQRVSEAPVLSSTTDPKGLVAYRQVTSVTFDAATSTYTLGLDNIQDGTFQPVSWLDKDLVRDDKSEPGDNLALLSGKPYNNGVEVPVGAWRTRWFKSQDLVGTLYWTGLDGKPVMTPVFDNVPLTIVGGIKSIKAQFTGTLPAKLLGTADAQGRYPVVGVLSFSTGRTASQIDASRAAMVEDILKLCQRHSFSWAHFCEDIDHAGFVGWRPTPAIRQLLARAARGDTI